MEDANEKELDQDHRKLKALRQNQQPTSNFNSVQSPTSVTDSLKRLDSVNAD